MFRVSQLGVNEMNWSYKPTWLLLLFAVAMANGYTSARADLVAHYKFEEATGATTAVNEVTANGGNGAIGANVVLGVAGVDGNAFTFSGGAAQADIVDMAAAPDIFSKITTSGQITVSYWLKSSDTGNRNVAVFMGNNTDNNDYLDSGILGNGQFAPAGSAYARNRKNTDAAAGIGDLGGGPIISSGAFHHIAFSINTAISTGIFYVDGVQADIEVALAKFGAFPTFNNFELGRLGRSVPTDGMAGSIDDLQIYNSIISARDISRLFQNPGATLVDLGPSVEGDTNDDGMVNITDFNNIRNSLGYTGLNPGLGVDIAGNDGVVNFRDLRYFQQNFPSVVMAALAAEGTQTVPEPSAVLLGLFAVGLVAQVAKRTSQRKRTH